MLQKISILNL